MKNIYSKYYLTSGWFGIVIFLFWLIGFPQALNYQEQNQLFLLTSDYFRNDLSIAGGLADYISEFIVQFYYVPWLGAILLALVFVILQQLTWKLMKHIPSVSMA